MWGRASALLTPVVWHPACHGPDMFHGRPRRLDAFAYAGFYRYHVRIATWNRLPHFQNEDTVVSARGQLFALAHGQAFAVNAYCFMPDHVHVLLAGRSVDARLRVLIGAWKQRSGYAFGRMLPGERLWQPSYFERVLRENEGNELVARYIVENPIRAGLATRLGEYPYAWCARDVSPVMCQQG
jgi:putative transposase